MVIEGFNNSYNKGQLSFSQTQAVITLIEKQGKDNSILANWRPISLLNTNYKILSKFLSNRLTVVLPSIVGEQQFGFIKGRYIGEYSRIVSEIMEYTKRKKVTGFLKAIYMEKAFDSLSWRFLYKTLNFFNFEESFIHWINILYTNSCASLINNGCMTKFF